VLAHTCLLLLRLLRLLPSLCACRAKADMLHLPGSQSQPLVCCTADAAPQSSHQLLLTQVLPLPP
jgi:hypothetical protein